MDAENDSTLDYDTDCMLLLLALLVAPRDKVEKLLEEIKRAENG